MFTVILIFINFFSVTIIEISKYKIFLMYYDKAKDDYDHLVVALAATETAYDDAKNPTTSLALSTASA